MESDYFPPEDFDPDDRSWLHKTGYEKPVDTLELNLALKRLREVDEYTRFINSKSRYHPNSVQGIRDNNVVRPALKKDYEDTLLKRVYPKYNDAERVPYGYEGDKKLLKQFIGHEVIKSVPKMIKRRKALISQIVRDYKNPKRQASLAAALSVVLCYRAGFPLVLTAETRDLNLSSIVSEAPVYLDAGPDPNTATDLYDWYSYAVTHYLPFASPWVSSWHEWSGRAGQYDTEYHSPFVDRFKAVWAAYGHKNLRSWITRAHPVCLVIDKFYTPEEVADMIRLTDVARREEKILEFIGKLEQSIVDSNNELHNDFAVDWDSSWPGHYAYDWGKYGPLLAVASDQLHKGNDPAIEYIVNENILPGMIGSSPTGILDTVLMVGGLALALASVYGKLSVIALSRIGRLLAFGGLVSASSNVYEAFVTLPNRQSREDIYKLLEKDLVAFENNSSKTVAAAMFFFEAFMFSKDVFFDFKIPQAAAPKKPALTPKPRVSAEVKPAVSMRATSAEERMAADLAADQNVYVIGSADEWQGLGSQTPLNVSASKNEIAGTPVFSEPRSVPAKAQTVLDGDPDRTRVSDRLGQRADPDDSFIALDAAGSARNKGIGAKDRFVPQTSEVDQLQSGPRLAEPDPNQIDDELSALFGPQEAPQPLARLEDVQPLQLPDPSAAGAGARQSVEATSKLDDMLEYRAGDVSDPVKDGLPSANIFDEPAPPKPSVTPPSAPTVLPETVALSADDQTARGALWDWFSKRRRDLKAKTGQKMTSTHAGELYREFVDYLNLPKARLRSARGYKDSLRKDAKIEAYWASLPEPRVKIEGPTGRQLYRIDALDIPQGTNLGDYLPQDVIANGPPYWLPREMIDFGHKLDVVVFDQTMFQLEIELAIAVESRLLTVHEARNISQRLKDRFMTNPRNYVPELRKLNQEHGAVLGQKVNYSSVLDPITATDRANIISSKGLGALSAEEAAVQRVATIDTMRSHKPLVDGFGVEADGVEIMREMMKIHLVNYPDSQEAKKVLQALSL